jgi:hypothetical protein
MPTFLKALTLDLFLARFASSLKIKTSVKVSYLCSNYIDIAKSNSATPGKLVKNLVLKQEYRVIFVHFGLVFETQQKPSRQPKYKTFQI